jgi:hypothetical protein
MSRPRSGDPDRPIDATRRRWRRLAPLALLAVVPLTACGDETDTLNAPVPEDASASGDPVVDGSTTTQSFLVQDSTPDVVITAYQSLAESDGWVVEDPPAQTGTTDWSLTMTKDGEVLVVTTAPAGVAGDPGEVELALQVTTDG